MGNMLSLGVGAALGCEVVGEALGFWDYFDLGVHHKVPSPDEFNTEVRLC